MSAYIPQGGKSAFKPKPIFFSVYFLRLLLTIAKWSIYIFALAIFFVKDLRVNLLNWFFIGIAAGYLLGKIAKSLSYHYGPSTLYFLEDKMVIKPVFGKIRSVEYEYVVHIDKQPRQFFTFFSPKYDIYTTDNKFSINPSRWKDSDKISQILEKYAAEVYNLYVKNAYYKNSIKHALRQILQTFQGKVGFIILLIYLLIALFGGYAMLFYPPVSIADPKIWIFYNPEYLTYFRQDFGVLQPPNKQFIFGTDFGGRDILSRMVFGTMITMSIAIVAALLVTLFISIFGLTAAIYGGVWDAFITRLSDVLMTFPQVVWIVLISVFSEPFRIGIEGGYFLAIYIGMSFVMWPLGARLVRSEVLEALSAEYVQAVELVGASRYYIIRHHVLPKVIPTIFLLYFYQLTDVIIGISLIGFLGFDSESTTVWGSDLVKAYQGAAIIEEWWTVVFPSLFIFGIVFGLTLFSDALRDSYTSKYRGGIQGNLHSSLGGK